MSALRDWLGIIASIATILGLGLQLLTFTGVIKVSQIEDLGVLPPGAAGKFFLAPYDSGVKKAREKDFSGAIEDYKRVTGDPGATDREKVQAYDAMGYAYFRKGDYDRAKQALSLAMQIDPKAPLPHVNMIKVRCAEHADPAEVQAALRYLRSFAPNYGHDAELMRFCAYAGITPDFR